MHVITKKRIKEAMQLFPHSANSLEGWLKIISRNHFKNFAEIKNTFGSVDKVGALTVFDIGGNKVRLIASIHFNRQRVYIRRILSHADYDQNNWQE